MTEDKVKIDIELTEEEWAALEKCRVHFYSEFDTIDELVNHILKKSMEEEEIEC